MTVAKPITFLVNILILLSILPGCSGDNGKNNSSLTDDWGWCQYTSTIKYSVSEAEVIDSWDAESDDFESDNIAWVIEYSDSTCGDFPSGIFDEGSSAYIKRVGNTITLKSTPLVEASVFDISQYSDFTLERPAELSSKCDSFSDLRRYLDFDEKKYIAERYNMLYDEYKYDALDEEECP